jgi:hypothetical protein
VRDNAAVGDVGFNTDELRAIDAAFPAKRRRTLALI